MFYELPPVGERISLASTANYRAWLKDWFAPYEPEYFDSGTSALAATLIAAAQRARVAKPEVVLPAYSCPQLVSAALFAGLRPRLVDLVRDRPWMDLESLRSVLSANTVAVVAVDLFGIPERYAMIRAALSGGAALLIQDSAQGMFNPVESRWQGDYVVLSFGRGKPISVLHGGVALSRDSGLAALLPKPQRLVRSRRTRATMRVMAYNTLLSAHLYWLPAGLPFLRLGETRFEPMRDIGPMDPICLGWVPANVIASNRRSRRAQTALREITWLTHNPAIINLEIACATEVPVGALLRYPLLVNDLKLRAALLECLNRAGMGASTMYPVALPRIKGLERVFPDEMFSMAERFASAVVALPVHGQVRERDAETVERCLRQVFM